MLALIVNAVIKLAQIFAVKFNRTRQTKANGTTFPHLITHKQLSLEVLDYLVFAQLCKN